MTELDYTVDAERHREMAEAYRAMAEHTFDDGLRAHYYKLAEAYDGLADTEARVTHKLKFSN